MESIDERSIIQLATSIADPNEFIKNVEALHIQDPFAEKGSLFERVGLTLVKYSSFSHFNHLISAWSHALTSFSDSDEVILEDDSSA